MAEEERGYSRGDEYNCIPKVAILSIEGDALNAYKELYPFWIEACRVMR